jgi:phytoene desaturase
VLSIKQKVNIIGSGVGGLATAIRLSHAGFEVTVFEKNAYPGGKLSEFSKNGYRFDKGPSLFTMPQLVDELSGFSVKQNDFKYVPLDVITHYFYEDGTFLKAYANKEQFAEEVSAVLGESKQAVLKHLKKSAFYYDTTADLFLSQSLHQIKNFFNLKTLKGIIRAPRLGLNQTMNAVNQKAFRNPKTVQLFNRYATYNGSDPYKAPALLNIIHHLEFGMGAYLPEKGMHQITEHLVDLAKGAGVRFLFNHTVDKVELSENKVKGLWANAAFFASDIVVSDADMHVLYRKLLPPAYAPEKLLKQEKSSSAFVFYWGIRKEFPELHLHNILFSENYREEFRCLFEEDKPYHDPTIYINITSKYCKSDAPANCENWFVMVNVPHNGSGKPISYAEELRRQVIDKINRILKTDIEQYIETEDTLDPLGIEQQTSSFGGSLYGNSSNNKYAAFLRHANYSSKIKGLYLVGGSVHPGGGIPLCLLSAKIATGIIKEKELK